MKQLRWQKTVYLCAAEKWKMVLFQPHCLNPVSRHDAINSICQLLLASVNMFSLTVMVNITILTIVAIISQLICNDRLSSFANTRSLIECFWMYCKPSNKHWQQSWQRKIDWIQTNQSFSSIFVDHQRCICLLVNLLPGRSGPSTFQPLCLWPSSPMHQGISHLHEFLQDLKLHWLMRTSRQGRNTDRHCAVRKILFVF